MEDLLTEIGLRSPGRRAAAVIVLSMFSATQLGTLSDQGFARIPGPFTRLEDAWSAAQALVEACGTLEAPVEVIGDFVIPPLDGVPSRDFQTLHFDFGVPLAPVLPADVARFTALHVVAEAPPGDAVTRLVPLRALLPARRWPDRDELVQRLAAYGISHGAWGEADGYVEGSLARIIDGALGETPVLPSVRTQPGFLCGAEFASLDEELAFFAQRGLRPDVVGIEIRLLPGELLVFDNLAHAHGRRGSRQPGELHQRVFGHQALTVKDQMNLRDRVLSAFANEDDPGRNGCQGSLQ